MKKSTIKTVLLLMAVALLTPINVFAEGANAPAEKQSSPAIELGVPFNDNMVLQRGIKVPVWGSSLPGATVKVSFNGQNKAATADEKGNWRILLDPMKAVSLKSVNETPVGKSMTISSVKGNNKAVAEITNIVIGDVWVCAGQSNMAGRMKRAGHPKNYPPNSVNDAKYPGLRFITFPKNKWQVCSPETAVSISRISFFFARRVQRETLVPMGLMITAVGGSNIESWLNQPPYPTGNHYTNLLKPWVGYGLGGAIWYQGESNEKDQRGYQPKLESLIRGWRKAWNQGDFPVHYVQLPGIGSSSLENPAGGEGRAEIRQAYFNTLALPNTGLAVTIDVGAKGEHPPNKYNTSDRLARSVLQKVYGFKEITSCPLYTKHLIEGKVVRITFDNNAAKGLMVAKKEGFLPPQPTPEAKLQWLSIQAMDGSWHWAEGTIDGSDLLVSSPEVKQPQAVRYAYTQHPNGNLLYNKDGMPVGPFSTGGYGPKSESKPKKKK